MVADRQSRFTFLAADLLSAAQPLPTPLQKTRVGGFRRHASGRLSRRRRDRSINTPGSRGCAYKTVSGRHEWLNHDPIQERGGINLYQFVFNNPLKHIDEYGLEGEDEGDENLDDAEYNPVYDLFGIQRPQTFGAQDEPNDELEPSPNDPNSQPLTPEQYQDGLQQADQLADEIANDPSGANANWGNEDEDDNENDLDPLKESKIPCPVKTPWGWSGGKPWKDAAKALGSPGTHEAVNGTVPTVDEARALLEELGVNPEDMRIEGGHAPPNPHTYPHINYPTPGGGRGTVKTQ
jgi:RHS repeat-associated protein